MSALRFAVIGSPVAHSLSPAIHTAAYRALGLPHVYEKLETSADQLPSRIAALREGAYAGLNVTVPYKTCALRFVDAIDKSAHATGAANTLVRAPDGTVHAHNTDAAALRGELVRLAGGSDRFAGRSAIVLGSGGAARAALFALGSLGIARVIVRSRRPMADLGMVLSASGVKAAISFEPLEPATSEPPDLVAIVQATTAGMAGGAPGDLSAGAIRWRSVPADCVVYDVVYAPRRTPLLDRAAAGSLANDGGIGMLISQGALAFELWLGIVPPIDVMRAAIV